MLFVSVTTSFILPPSQDSYYAQVGALSFQAIAKTCVTKGMVQPGGRRLAMTADGGIDFTDATVLQTLVQVHLNSLFIVFPPG